MPSHSLTPRSAHASPPSTIWSRIGVGGLALAAMICAALWVLVSLRFSLGFNSHYVDESDYMFAGRLLLDGSAWPTKSYIFSSNLPLYLIGWGASLDKELGARALSLIPGLLSLCSLFLLYCSLLNDRRLALGASALIALQATHIFQSKLATYDIWCFFLFSTAAWQLYRHSQTRRAVSPAMIAGSVLFALAVLTKYVAIIYAPAIFLLLWVSCSRGSALMFAVFQLLIVGIYALQNSADLLILFNQQLAGQHLQNSTAPQLLQLLVMLLWPLLLLSVPTIYKAASRRQSFLDRPPVGRPLLRVLLALALVLPAYHLASGNRIAVYKHALYSAMFLAPLAAAGAALLLRALPTRVHSVAIALASALLLALAAAQTNMMERAYPNTTAVLAALDARVDHRSRILSENPYLHRNHFLDRLALSQLYDMDALPQPDSERNRARLLREFSDARYDFVLLDERFQPALARFLRSHMPAHYELVHTESYATSNLGSGNTHGHITLHQATR